MGTSLAPSRVSLCLLSSSSTLDRLRLPLPHSSLGAAAITCDLALAGRLSRFDVSPREQAVC